MADISEESGKRIEAQAYDHKRAKPLETKHTNMVQQPKPTSTAWKIWKQFIHKLLRHRQTTWKRTLGRWVVPSDEIRRLYTYYRTETELFKREKGKIKKWNIIAGSTFMSKQFQSYNTEKIPRSAIPCVICLTENIYTEYQQVVIEESQEKEARWIAEKIIAVTDASVIEGKGTWAYFIADINGNIIEEMSDYKREHLISSFRAEMFGVKNVLKGLQNSQEETNIRIYCDNEAVIKAIQKLKRKEVSYQDSDSDILYECKHLISQNMTFHHVKGHQSEEESNTFPIEVNLNIRADKAAKNMHSLKENNFKQENYYAIRTTYKDETITSYPVKTIRSKVQINQSEAYLQKKFGVHYPDVKWTWYLGAIKDMKRIPISITKMIHNITPPGIHVSS